MTATTPDQYTQPEQPVAAAVQRPKELIDGNPGIIGLRAASTQLISSDRVIDVWLYGDPPTELTDPALWSLRAAPGAPQPGITAVTSVNAITDSDGTPIPAHLRLTLDSVLPGRGVYQLRIDANAVGTLGIDVDPLRVFLPVGLRPECGELGDCVSSPARHKPVTPPDYDTLARDYAALRATLLERLQFDNPTADTSVADLEVTLVELFAHLGDLLHYRLDRTATEMWLATARRRANVTRLARAVDYPVYPAISAATTIQVVVARTAGHDALFKIEAGDVATDAASTDPVTPSATCFTLEESQDVYSSHDEIALYDWCEGDAALTVGATSAVLVLPRTITAPLADWLPVGTLLGFEVVGVDDLELQSDWLNGAADTAVAANAAWPRPALASHPAQVVRVTAVVPFTDPLKPSLPLVRVFWSQSDALAATVPCSVEVAGGARVGVGRLGLVPAHHGLAVDGTAALTATDRLTGAAADPLTQQVSDYLLLAAGPEGAPGLSHRPGGRPWHLTVNIRLPNGNHVEATRVTSLLRRRRPSAGFSYVVDADDELPARLRFATGAIGVVPPAGSTVTARYEVGAGPAGNVAAGTLHRLVRTTTTMGEPCVWLDLKDAGGRPVSARNITPGIGGIAATPLDDARRDAPQAYSAQPRRAVLVADLPPFATQVPGVSRASARRSWSGSWPVGVVAYESAATDTGVGGDPLIAAGLASDVQSTLDAVRMCGTEVIGTQGVPVGIILALTVCLYPTADSDTARAAILSTLRPGTPDAPGLFAPGAHPMGSSVYLSKVVAAVAALSDVDAVSVTEARRLSDPPGTRNAVVVMSPNEVAVCDDDKNFPDRGRIVLTVEGGR